MLLLRSENGPLGQVVGHRQCDDRDDAVLGDVNDGAGPDPAYRNHSEVDESQVSHSGSFLLLRELIS